METSLLTSIILPASLFIIMFGMGLSLVMADFKRVIRFPKAVIIGLVNQIIVLPIVAFTIIYLLDLSPIIAIGFMLVASCPGGVTSNLISHVSKGDTALSITLTAISSILTVFTIPIIIAFSINYFLGDSETIQLPILKTIMQILVITIIPVSIGMLIKHLFPNFASKMDKPTRVASTVIFIIIIIGIVFTNIEIVKKHIFELGWISLLLNIITITIGFYAAKLFNLKLPQRISIAIESGIQNGTLAIVIAMSILKQPEIAIPGAIYSLIMFFSGGLMMWYFGKVRK